MRARWSAIVFTTSLRVALAVASHSWLSDCMSQDLIATRKGNIGHDRGNDHGRPYN
jgi:hypothetical protein